MHFELFSANFHIFAQIPRKRIYTKSRKIFSYTNLFSSLSHIITGDYEYKESPGNWVKFNQNIQRLIYAANLFDIDKVTYTHQKVKFIIDLLNMTEINEKKNTKRKLRRDGVSPDENDEKNESEEGETNNGGTSIKDEDFKEEEEEEPKRKSNKKIPEKNKKTAENKENVDDEMAVRSISFKGKAPVDPECFSKHNYHVYYEADDIYDAMLNQTNLKNNNNKFYLMQVLRTNKGTSYAVWFRWGRVGMIGQTNLINCGTDLEKAKDTFLKKYLSFLFFSNILHILAI